MKTKLLAGAMALVLVGCSEKSASSLDSGPGGTASYDVQTEEAPPSSMAIPAPPSAIPPPPDASMRAAPNVSVSAAPGVAFNYAYAFRLDDNRIAKVQEDHAAACEALGINRCRITGMQYRLVRENEVEAQLQFRLDPAIARKFGKDALASVEKAEGVLADARISGDDVGSQISDSQRRSADLNAEIARIEARLRQGGLGDRERAELQQQVAQMRSRLDGERDTRRQGEAMLATTPMSFHYVGTGGLPGIGYGNPFSDGAAMLVRSGSTLLSFVLVFGAALLPWALLVLLLLALWRSPIGGAARRVIATKPPTAEPATA